MVEKNNFIRILKMHFDGIIRPALCQCRLDSLRLYLNIKYKLKAIVNVKLGNNITSSTEPLCLETSNAVT